MTVRQALDDVPQPDCHLSPGDREPRHRRARSRAPDGSRRASTGRRIGTGVYCSSGRTRFVMVGQ
ncbi:MULTISPECIES: hypothetical protein [Streptomyces]|uniref:Uncharacterized protein n=1 Tax=Streptomyces turgidiscabies (strain Car8) TaxID=698760 RepID=L7FEB0_STRT8|nr:MULTISPECIES: hypothetical protein [Streptomyces]ELP69544.1 hypothetical protein STRTUCAR8_00614 [Streptomyces turgidiscabies Car8]MDX3496145.1 hypothetical protein [Streptomyces turgidiscabies]